MRGLLSRALLLCLMDTRLYIYIFFFFLIETVVFLLFPLFFRNHRRSGLKRINISVSLLIYIYAEKI